MEQAEKTIALARDTDPKKRRRAIVALGQLSERSADVARVAVPVLTELLKHDDPATRAEAVDALGEIGDARTFRTADLEGAGNPLLISENTLPALVATLADPHKGVQERTPGNLGKIVEYNLAAAERALAEVRPLLMSDQAGARAAAAEAVNHMAGRLGRTAEALRKASDPQTAQKSERISGLFAPLSPLIEGLLKDADAEVRREAESALKAIRALK